MTSRDAFAGVGAWS